MKCKNNKIIIKKKYNLRVTIYDYFICTKIIYIKIIKGYNLFEFVFYNLIQLIHNH